MTVCPRCHRQIAEADWLRCIEGQLLDSACVLAVVTQRAESEPRRVIENGAVPRN